MPASAIPEGALLGPNEWTSITKTEPPDFLRPYLEDYLRKAVGTVYPGGQLAPYPFPDQRVAAFSPFQQAAQRWASSYALTGPQLTEPLNAEALRTISGQYLYPGTNPYMDATFNAAAKNVTDQYRYGTAPARASEFSHANSFGGSAYNQARAMDEFGYQRGLNDLASDMYGRNYQAERQRMIQEQSLIPEVRQAGYLDPQALYQTGTQQQGLGQTLFDTAYKNQTQRAAWPFTALDIYRNALGAGGGYQTQTATTPNMAAQAPGQFYLGTQISPGLTPFVPQGSGGGGGGFMSSLSKAFNPFSGLGGLF